MNYGDEIDVLLFFKSTLDTLIAANLVTVKSWGDLTDLDEAALTVDNKRILWVSRLQVIIDPDEKFEIQDENTNRSKPVLLIGIGETNPTSSSVQGNMIYGDNVFDFIVMVAKTNRAFTEYFREITAIKRFLTDSFIASTNKRILIGPIRWSDYIVGKIPGSGFTMKVTTSINNYDYTVT